MDDTEVWRQSLLWVVLLAIYLLPSIIARVNRLRSSVYVINVLFGWTVIGWLIALSLALSEMHEKQCPACAKWVDKRATSCPYCHKPLEVRTVVGDKS